MNTVKEERWKYIGGSDIPIIMNISQFKTRWELLLDKAEPARENIGNLITNEAIEYGNTMEPIIRDYINESGRSYTPDVFYGEGHYHYRCNVDGIDRNIGSILEIKTTSVIHEKLNDYKTYLVQLLFYMKVAGIEKGMLAVYERPEDYSTEFDPMRLKLYSINIKEYDDWLEEIDFAIERFVEDLNKVKANPLLTEEDLQPKEVIEFSNWVLSIEDQFNFYKKIEEEHKTAMAALKKAMQKHGIKRWITNSGYKITLVADGEDKTVQELDMKSLQRDLPDLFKDESEGGYMVPKLKKGRAGYVKVTAPKRA